MNKIIITSIVILGVFTLVTQVAKVYISNTTSLEGITATRIQSELDAYTEENLVLRDKVLSYTSYHTIASRAADLGLVATREIVSVYDPVKVAFSR